MIAGHQRAATRNTHAAASLEMYTGMYHGTSTALNYYTALKFTSNSSFTAAQRPKRILAILEGIFYGRAAADEIFSDTLGVPFYCQSGSTLGSGWIIGWVGAAHRLLNPPAFRREALPATIRGSTSRYGTSVQAPTLDVAGSLPQPVGASNHTTQYLTIQYIAEKSLFTVVQPPMTFLAGVKDLFTAA